MDKKSLSVLLSNFGLLIIMVASALPLLRMMTTSFGYLYAVGAVMVLVGKILQPIPKEPLRLRRLLRMEIWTAIIFMVGAAFAVFPMLGSGRDWLAFTLAGGVLTIYTSIMIPRQKLK